MIQSGDPLYLYYKGHHFDTVVKEPEVIVGKDSITWSDLSGKHVYYVQGNHLFYYIGGRIDLLRRYNEKIGRFIVHDTPNNVVNIEDYR